MAKSTDTVRKSIVAATAVLAIAGAFIGSGAAGGTPMSQAGDGAFDSDATAIAPGGPAFSIWSIIYVGLVAYAIWQFFPKATASERHRKLGYPIAWSLALNAAWLFAVQLGLLWLSIVIIVVLLGVLVRAFLVAADSKSLGVVDAIITDGTIGLYLGWVCVATAANVAAVLVAYGFDGFGADPAVWAIPVLVVAGIAGFAIALRGRGRFTPSLALGWGLAWIAIARLTAEPESVATGVTAIVVAVAVLIGTIVIRILRGESAGTWSRSRAT